MSTREIAMAIVDTFDWKNDVEGLVICDPTTLAERIDAALAKAIADERERCAGIAEEYASFGNSYKRVRKEIAANIRRVDTADTEGENDELRKTS